MISRVLCWWFGCNPDVDALMPTAACPCTRCDNPDVSYDDMVGMTRHNALKEWLAYWLFRKWVPAPCKDCGKRYGEHPDCLPF